MTKGKNSEFSFIPLFWKIMFGGTAAVFLIFLLATLGALGEMPDVEDLENPKMP